MEPATTSHFRLKFAIILAVAILVFIAGFFFYTSFRNFCFTFDYNMQFGDRKVANPSNEGFMGPGGIIYFPVEVQALQKVLKKEGFYIDPLEETGGGTYLSSFFGPSTQTAVRKFQAKYDLAETGDVNNVTVDKLNERYGCPKMQTPSQTTGTTTSQETK